MKRKQKVAWLIVNAHGDPVMGFTFRKKASAKAWVGDTLVRVTYDWPPVKPASKRKNP